MATKIRLQRHGKKGKPFYYVVVADSRAPRDGRFIERLGSYNPNTNPAIVDLNFDKALDWLNKGAQPTDTCRSILSHQGVLYKKHLEGGVKKGAFTAEQAEEKFAQWLQSKEAKLVSKKEGLSKSQEEVRKAALAAEAKKKADRAAAIAARNTPPAEETAAEEAPAEEVAEEEAVAEETVAETPAEETPVAEAPAEETPVAESPAEAPEEGNAEASEEKSAE